MYKFWFFTAPVLFFGLFACGEDEPKKVESELVRAAVSSSPKTRPQGAQKEKRETAKQADGAFEVASFAVPDLDRSLAARLAEAIAELAGVHKAVPRLEQGRFDVEFSSPKTTPAMLLEKMKGLAPSISLSGVRPADSEEARGHACGGCPMRNECGGH